MTISHLFPVFLKGYRAIKALLHIGVFLMEICVLYTVHFPGPMRSGHAIAVVFQKFRVISHCMGYLAASLEL